MVKKEKAMIIIKRIIRKIIKYGIKLFDLCTSWIPLGKHDILILKDFKNSDINFVDELQSHDIKIINFKFIKILKSAFYIRRANVIYVDNINIVIGALSNIEGVVIQYWHATSAIKKFGLTTVTNEREYSERTKELNNYDLIAVNSDYMAENFKRSFAVSDEKIIKIGAVHSYKLFNQEIIKPYFEYIVYVPTFRSNPKSDKKALQFITNFKNDKYKLIYSLHPKIDVQVDSEDALDVTGTDIRCYFANASLVISDYSSLLVDASLKCKSAVMYAYDIDEYEVDPGLIINEHNFWGYYTTSETQLIKYINDNNFITHDLTSIKDKYFTYDDQNSNIRIAQIAKRKNPNN